MKLFFCAFLLFLNNSFLFSQSKVLSFYRAEHKDGSELWTFYGKNISTCTLIIKQGNLLIDSIRVQNFLKYKKYSFYRYNYTYKQNDEAIDVFIKCNNKLLFEQKILKTSTKDSLKFILGSCNLSRTDLGKTPPYFTKYLPTRKIVGSNKIFEAMNAEKSNFMLWLGDNVYYIGKRNHGDYDKMMYRQLKHRKNPSIKKFINNNIHHTTWDDHDYGPNNSGGKFKRKWESRQVFNLFWSDTTDLVFDSNRITKYFEKGDAAFFVLDVRWDRKEGETMLGKAQMQWLKDKLLSCEKPIKFIVSGSQVLNNSTFTDTWSSFGNEREALFNFIDTNRIKGIVFLTGDRHMSCLFSKTLNNGTILYDYTSSALTSFSFPRKMSIKHDFPQPGFDKNSYTNARNYGTISVKRTDVGYDIDICTKDYKGKKIWNKTIKLIP